MFDDAKKRSRLAALTAAVWVSTAAASIGCSGETPTRESVAAEPSAMTEEPAVEADARPAGVDRSGPIWIHTNTELVFRGDLRPGRDDEAIRELLRERLRNLPRGLPAEPAKEDGDEPLSPLAKAR